MDPVAIPGAAQGSFREMLGPDEGVVAAVAAGGIARITSPAEVVELVATAPLWLHLGGSVPGAARAFAAGLDANHQVHVQEVCTIIVRAPPPTTVFKLALGGGRVRQNAAALPG